MSSFFCHYCKKNIRDQDELITASRWFSIKPFHYQCFKQLEEETTSQRNLYIPVNGPSGMVTVVIMLLLSGWMLFTNTLNAIGDMIGIIALYPVLLRIISYFTIESKLPKYIENKPPIDRE
ncbi:hypothetical protein HNQ94_000237 [Salirhabdus euzebyi]|uniref:Uncharacterized protein n=1 Tax=Salirhabdus euzebyi TaxID=394506 RepID=A0A841PWT2_9BACI|nr:hypothetical protein [Salirhabdus euzebyi]MBB6451816.1 hypothetical protein [Salirhabdus euzebyi]